MAVAVVICPHCGGKNPATNLGCTSCGSDISTVIDEMLPTATDDWTRVLSSCSILGGYGLNLRRRGLATLRFSSSGIEIATALDDSLNVPTAALVGLQISGPGKVTSGGGFIGGGFGVDGALVGIGVASLLNALTTKTSTFTFIQLETTEGEVFFHYGGMEPSALRMELSPVFVMLRLRRAAG